MVQGELGGVSRVQRAPSMGSGRGAMLSNTATLQLHVHYCKPSPCWPPTCIHRSQL